MQQPRMSDGLCFHQCRQSGAGRHESPEGIRNEMFAPKIVPSERAAADITCVTDLRQHLAMFLPPNVMKASPVFVGTSLLSHQIP